MAILVTDLTVDQGVDYPDLTDPTTYTWATGTSIATAVPVNLTGYTAKMEVRASYNAMTALLTLTDVSGIAITPLTGTIQINITKAQSLALPAGSLVYDLLLTAGTGQTYKFMRGALNVIPLVSQ